MTKYRIVKVLENDSLYKAQRRFMYFFWLDFGLPSNLDFIKKTIRRELEYAEMKKHNPKSIIHSEY